MGSRTNPGSRFSRSPSSRTSRSWASSSSRAFFAASGGQQLGAPAHSRHACDVEEPDGPQAAARFAGVAFGARIEHDRFGRIDEKRRSRAEGTALERQDGSRRERGRRRTPRVVARRAQQPSTESVDSGYSRWPTHGPRFSATRLAVVGGRGTVIDVESSTKAWTSVNASAVFVSFSRPIVVERSGLIFEPQSEPATCPG